MKKYLLSYTLVLGGLVFHTFGMQPYAASEVPDEIDMENEAYEEHKRDIVVFSHKSHSETYSEAQPEFFKAGCGECHHDENKKPLDLKPGDDVKGCIACHSKPGRMPVKEKRALRKSGLTKAERKSNKLAYHADVLHDNCRGCHRDFNRKNSLKSKDERAAPIRCGDCH
jgi:hypothetical protein